MYENSQAIQVGNKNGQSYEHHTDMILNSNMTHTKPTLKELGQNHWHETCVFRTQNIFPVDSFGRLCFYVFCIFAKRSTLTKGRHTVQEDFCTIAAVRLV